MLLFTVKIPKYISSGILIQLKFAKILSKISNPTLNTCKDLVHYAQMNNLWIFEPQSKTWYTPEEFHQNFGHSITGHEDFFAGCQPRNPTDGVVAGMTRVQRLQDQISGFMDKIITYYKNR